MEIKRVELTKGEDATDALLNNWKMRYNYDRGLPKIDTEQYYVRVWIELNRPDFPFMFEYPLLSRLRSPMSKDILEEMGMITITKPFFSPEETHDYLVVKGFGKYFFFRGDLSDGNPVQVKWVSVTEDNFYDHALISMQSSLEPMDGTSNVNESDLDTETLYSRFGERFRYKFIAFRNLIVLLDFNISDIPENELQIPYTGINEWLERLYSRSEIKSNKKIAWNFIEETKYELKENQDLMQKLMHASPDEVKEIKKQLVQSFNKIKELSNNFRSELYPHIFTQTDADWMI